MRLKLAEQIEACDIRNLRWGALAPKTFMARAPRVVSLAGFREISWTRDCKTGADAQTLGTCTCNALMGDAEDALWRAQALAVQLDYDRLYLEVRLEWYNDRADGGAELHMPFETARRLGVLPPDTQIVRPENTPAGICAALVRGPLIVGISVDDGWKPSRLHPVNGAIDETGATVGKLPYTNGHALRLMGTARLNGRPVYVLRNSWGPIGQRGDGLVCCTVQYYHKWALDFPILIDYGPDWRNWRGWDRNGWVLRAN